MPIRLDASALRAKLLPSDVDCYLRRKDELVKAAKKPKLTQVEKPRTSSASNSSTSDTLVQTKVARPCILSDMDLESESRIPDAVRQRRQAWYNRKYEVVHTLASIEVCNSKLRLVLDDDTSSKAAKEKAERCAEFLKQYVRYLQEVATRKTVGNNAQLCYVMLVQYMPRHGAARWYACAPKMDSKQSDKMRTFSVQGMPRPLRQFLCSTYHDIDIINAHPVLMMYLAAEAGVKTPFLQDYVNFRAKPNGRYFKNGWIQDVASFHGIDVTHADNVKGTIKPLFLRLLYGGSYEEFLKDLYGEHDSRIKRHNEHVSALASEVAQVNTAITKTPTWKRFCEFHTSRLKAEDERQEEEHASNISAAYKQFARKARPLLPRVVALVLQTVEADVLQLVMQVFIQAGYTVSSLIHDGFHVAGDDLSHQTRMDEMLRKAETRVFDVLGWSVKVEEKPLFGMMDMPLNLLD